MLTTDAITAINALLIAIDTGARLCEILPILADALEDAGRDGEAKGLREVLDSDREPGRFSAFWTWSARGADRCCVGESAFSGLLRGQRSEANWRDYQSRQEAVMDLAASLGRARVEG